MRSLLGRFHRPMSRGLVNNMLTMNNLGDGSTLSLDFTTMGGVLDPRLTFSRASTATYINSSGYVTSAAINTPRFDYSPTNIGEPRGLLVEGQSANLTTYSEDFANINWTKDNSGGFVPVVTTVAATTPANGASVNQIVFDKTGGLFSRIQRTSAGTASTPYTMSVWMRTVSGTANVGLRIGADPAGFNCAVTTTWKRFQYTYTLSSTDSSAQIMLWDNIIGNDEIATVYVWGCQVEAGSGASSYIPTGASQVTRNKDQCYIYDATTSGGLSWFKTATQGTIYVEAYKRTAGTSFAGALYGTRATATQDFMLYQAIGNNWLSLNWGAGEYVTNYSALSSPYLIKSAVAFSPGSPTTKADSTVSINGSNSALSTTPNIALPFASDLFCIGSRGSANGVEPTQNYADTAIRRIKFYPFAMTTAQMNTLTTL